MVMLVIGMIETNQFLKLLAWPNDLLAISSAIAWDSHRCFRPRPGPDSNRDKSAEASPSSCCTFDIARARVWLRRCVPPVDRLYLAGSEPRRWWGRVEARVPAAARLSAADPSLSKPWPSRCWPRDRPVAA